MPDTFIAERTSRKPRLGTLLLISAIVTNVPACAFLDKVDKISKIPGLDEALEKEALKKKPGQLGEREPVLSRLQATPPVLDFGGAAVASERHQTVVIFNPSEFAVSVIRVTVQGTGFAVSPQAANRVDIPAHGQLGLIVTFQPPARRACSGLLLIEIDSAGGRATRVVLKGRGI